MSLSRLSHCKINLLLNVLGRRTDGFHELEMVMLPVPLCDQIELTRCTRGIHLECSDPEIPTDEKNLVWKAADRFFCESGIDEGIQVRLKKNIPAAAGLGGGSGNAASTLLGLNELFGLPLQKSRLETIASDIGSDVPFFLQPGPAIATGRGEQIEPLPIFRALRNHSLLLINPGFGVPTPWAYKSLAEYPGIVAGNPGRAHRLANLLSNGTLKTAVGEFYNALEKPVFYKHPLLPVIKAFLMENGAATLMSGSGATIFAILPTPQKAEVLQEAFLSKFGQNSWHRTIRLDISH